MAAAPWKGTIHIDYVDGSSDDIAVSASDVANAFMTYDNSGLTFFNMRTAGAITDITIVTGGTDCNKLSLWVNNADKNRVLLQPSLLTTVTTRPKMSPIKINAGRVVQFKQLAV